MVKIITTLGILLVVGGLAYHFAALAIFNALVPKDAGSSLAQSGVAYGTGQRQRFDVYKPDGEGPFPVLVFGYGGSWDSGRRQDYGFVGRAFAANGYVTVIPDYRVVPQAHYPDFVNDMADALAEAQRQAAKFSGDPARLYFVGHSAGGYNVAQAALLPGLLESRGINRQHLKAVATIASPLDVVVMDFPITRAAFGRAPDLPGTQPVNQVRADAPPFLLLHGSADKTVKPYNAEHMEKALRGVGAIVERKLYAGVSHVDILLALAKPFRGRTPVLADILAFFQKYR